MDDERAPDHEHDPRDQSSAPGGYPEDQPDGAASSEGTDTGPAGESGKGGGDTGARERGTPSTSTPKEGDRAASTGNPHAAG
ncbi:MAG TPA: hypothetical protein VFT50_04980 [Baekduia sp.]|nr:hypothetical protein [Baekduia sp.]